MEHYVITTSTEGGAAPAYRRTRIVCTLGPASWSEERIEELARAGMNVARINFSHGTQDEHAETIARVRRVEERIGHPIAVLQDLQGPKIRVGALADHQMITLRDGQTFTITTRDIVGDASAVSTTYAALPQDVKPGDRILLADGAIELRVIEVSGQDVTTEVKHGGPLSEHQGINLPGVAVSAPALTDKDRADVRFGVRHGVDFIALSFVRRSEDVRAAKALIAEEIAANPDRVRPKAPTGLHPAVYVADQTIPLIAKLEKPEAIANLDSILMASDGVMVARGDLGVEMPLEQVPLIQKKIIARANALRLPVITATQMLESMITHPRPTRAEASDVANAILDGTDAVMLSAETATGQYPIETVRVMARIAVQAESACERPSPDGRRGDKAQAVASAANTLAHEAGARLIVVFTRTGVSAQLISKERPSVPIVAFSPFQTVYRRLALWWGVMPRYNELKGTIEQRIASADLALRESGLAQLGDEVVIMGGMPSTGPTRTNFVKLHRIGELEEHPA
ncbi:MAG TPA: pyruvate kinase [Ktedonobacterales bacterium]|nr:pyruvate kinase [Ktedonobacterales bacterium]